MIANQVATATSTTAASSSSSPAANLNEMMEGLSLMITTASASDMRACSHGSTSTHFPDGRAYSDVIPELLLAPKETVAQKGFKKSHPEYFRDFDFSQYLFALCTSWYLKLNGTTFEMRLILMKAVEIKHFVEIDAFHSGGPAPEENKLDRYSRAIWTNKDRGVINCLSRETKSFCNCMGEKKNGSGWYAKIRNVHGMYTFFSAKRYEEMRWLQFCDVLQR